MTSESTVDDELGRAAEAVARLDRGATILLVCHVQPDGDALGSMLGFVLLPLSASQREERDHDTEH